MSKKANELKLKKQIKIAVNQLFGFKVQFSYLEFTSCVTDFIETAL